MAHGVFVTPATNIWLVEIFPAIFRFCVGIKCYYGTHELALTFPPFPQIDIIGAMIIVWRVRGKIVRSVLCSIVRNSCAQCNAHTYERT